MEQQIISSILAALLPFVVTYLSKRNKTNIRKYLLEESKNRIDFIDNYFELSKKIAEGTDIDSIKTALALELSEIKNNLNLIYKKDEIYGYERLSNFQKLFLTFKPITVLGWIWLILFYLILILTFFTLFGCFIDGNDDFSLQEFLKNMADPDMVSGMAVLILLILLFRWLALVNYKNKSSKK